jgi:hypothetical protein
VIPVAPRQGRDRVRQGDLREAAVIKPRTFRTRDISAAEQPTLVERTGAWPGPWQRLHHPRHGGGPHDSLRKPGPGIAEGGPHRYTKRSPIRIRPAARGSRESVEHKTLSELTRPAGRQDRHRPAPPRARSPSPSAGAGEHPGFAMHGW